MTYFHIMNMFIVDTSLRLSIILCHIERINMQSRIIQQVLFISHVYLKSFININPTCFEIRLLFIVTKCTQVQQKQLIDC